ncbi:MAG: helix-turn-helix transcriptional regulator [Bacteroidota bacterium]
MNPYSLTKQPMDIRQELAARHKQLRKHAGYTQADLARRSGVSLGSLKRFEQSGQISLDNLLKLARILGKLEEFDRVLSIPEDMEAIERLFSDEMRRK